MEKLEEEIGKWFNLSVNSFRVKYMYKDGKWILLTCDDDDLEFCMEMLASFWSECLFNHRVLEFTSSHFIYKYWC